MARPKSADKRNAIMDAAIRVIVAQGLSAPTATIAKEAGISNGSLFTYFQTKAELYNQLYFEIKKNMIADVMRHPPKTDDFRKQLSHAWSRWMDWAVSNPEKRHVMTQLMVSEDITQETREAVGKMAVELNALMERIRMHGALRTAPMSFVFRLVNALVEATMDAMIHEPANAKKHSKIGFETFWRAIS